MRTSGGNRNICSNCILFNIHAILLRSVASLFLLMASFSLVRLLLSYPVRVVSLGRWLTDKLQNTYPIFQTMYCFKWVARRVFQDDVMCALTFCVALARGRGSRLLRVGAYIGVSTRGATGALLPHKIFKFDQGIRTFEAENKSRSNS